MKLHRSLPIALCGLLLASAAPDAAAQALMLRGGPSVMTNPSDPEVQSGGVSGYGAIGARLWLTNLFELQGSVGYDDRLSLETELLIRPFSSDLRYEPFLFVGVGGQFEGDDRRGVVPAGVGVEYHASEHLGVFFQLAGRWQSRRNPLLGVNELDFSVAPSVGAAIKFHRRPPGGGRAHREEETPVVEQVADAPSSAAEATAAAAAPADCAAGVASSSWGWQMGGDVVDAGSRVRVPDGTFVMGLTDEDPLALQTAGIKRVTVSSFYIDKVEVGNGAYRAWVESLDGAEQSAMTPDAGAWTRAGSTTSFESYFESGAFDDYPVVAVTWDQAQAFCTAQGGRLPTEAEWEYAARSGQPGGIYPWLGFETRDPSGHYLANFNPGRAVYAADGYAFTAPANAFPPSPWGLFNLAGNAAEWTYDAFSPSYSALSDFNPRYENAEEPLHVVRGGSWASDDFYIGVGVRDAQAANEASIFTGFRCAYDAGAVDSAASSSATPASTPAASPAPSGETSATASPAGGAAAEDEN